MSTRRSGLNVHVSSVAAIDLDQDLEHLLADVRRLSCASSQFAACALPRGRRIRALPRRSPAMSQEETKHQDGRRGPQAPTATTARASTTAGRRQVGAIGRATSSRAMAPSAPTARAASGRTAPMSVRPEAMSARMVLPAQAMSRPMAEGNCWLSVRAGHRPRRRASSGRRGSDADRRRQWTRRTSAMAIASAPDAMARLAARHGLRSGLSRCRVHGIPQQQHEVGSISDYRGPKCASGGGRRHSRGSRPGARLRQAGADAKAGKPPEKEDSGF